MAAIPVLTYHDGKLDVPESLQRHWKLTEGAELRVVSASASRILLEAPVNEIPVFADAIAAWNSLRGVSSRQWTAEGLALAQARKERATENLERLYKSGSAGATELKQAEREWELADDELDFGPFERS